MYLLRKLVAERILLRKFRCQQQPENTAKQKKLDRAKETDDKKSHCTKKNAKV